MCSLIYINQFESVVVSHLSLAWTNALAYYAAVLITDVKSF
jgi:hypothetical protein